MRYLALVTAAVSFASSFGSLPLYFGYGDAIFFLSISIYLLLSCLEFFYRSSKNEGIGRMRIIENIAGGPEIDYSLSSIIFATDEIDATRAIFETKVGKEVLLRSGLSLEMIQKFIHSDRHPIISSSLSYGDGEVVGFVSYLETIYEADESFRSFLSRYAVTREDFLGAAAWVGHKEAKKRRENRFWSRENLGAIPSIGTSWAYGMPYDLNEYGRPFNDALLVPIDLENGYRQKEVETLEGVLTRVSEANAIIIDDDESVVRDILARFVKNIKLGTIMPALEHKQLIELDWQSLVSNFKDKSAFENQFMKIMQESALAGNVLLYIPDLSGFISRLKNAGINLSSLISPYLASSRLHIITHATTADFHFFIETSSALLGRFERIIPEPAGAPATTSVLLEQSTILEERYQIIFSYPSLVSLVEAAERFVTYGEMPGKALDLIYEIAPWAAEKGDDIVSKQDVAVFVSGKTGIKTGEIQADEMERIEHLSEALHKRVVGQNEAVEAVVGAIRRSRSGIGNPKRPIASFLFLGPTGVGKTEVSKALAESFFGDEHKMIRFDMSEYDAPDALPRLIGNFAENKKGILASKVRDNPYSVLLLDEFEKASPDVLDLFLQVLDEGVFSDAEGKPVGCRNLIIIATSNAGAEYIWEKAKTGSLVAAKDEIVDNIVKDHVFKPELLNRFDGVILFHPLEKTDLEHVTRIGLEKLVSRLKEKNIEFVVSDFLVKHVAAKGEDPKFGGRAINRAIQSEVEDVVARKIVSGEVKPGSKLELTQADFNS